MDVRYGVRADVFDITQTVANNSDRFLVDSNVWLWMTYTNSGHGESSWRKTIMNHYATFVLSTSAAGARVCCCGLSLAELIHVVEKIEREIHQVKTVTTVGPKEFRHRFPEQRQNIVAEITNAWNQVTSIAEFLSITIDPTLTDNAIQRLQAEKVDGYDLFLLETMMNNNVDQVITDDADFASVPNIQVFTANRNVIQDARSLGKLRIRDLVSETQRNRRN